MLAIKKSNLVLLVAIVALVLALILWGPKAASQKAQSNLSARLKEVYKNLRTETKGLEKRPETEEAKQKLARLNELKNQGEAVLSEKQGEAAAAREKVEKTKAQVDGLQQQAGAAETALEDGSWLDALKSKFFNDVAETEASAVLPECERNGYETQADCELYLRARNAQLECKLSGIASAAECKQFHLGRYGRPLKCEALTEDECDRLIDSLIIGDFVTPAATKQAGETVAPLLGQSFEIKDTGTNLEASRLGRNADNTAAALGGLKEIFPLALSEAGVKLHFHSSPVVERLRAEVVPAVLQFDDDGDGLPNEIERRLGTDSNRPDSDGDGFDDGTEVGKGFNPIGTGTLIRPLRPAEIALAGQVPLEQPKVAGEASADLQIAKVENIGKRKAPLLRLEGRALPNEVVSLFIYSSMPIVVSVETDQSGNWIFDLDKSLVNGRHEAYLVVNDERGKIKSKSEPYSFFINSARAISQEEYMEAEANLDDQTSGMLGWYAAAGAAMVVFAGLLVILSQRTKKKYSL